MTTASQVLILAAVALAAGVASQALRHNPLPWRQNWSQFVAESSAQLGVHVATLEDARRAVESHRYILLDARPPADFAQGHLSGAFSVPSEEISKYLPQVLPLLTPDQPILTYCSGHQCDESLKLTQHLIANNFTNVMLFAGGISDWTAAGLPLEK